MALTVGGYILVDFIIFLEGLGTIQSLVGALVATIGIIALAIVTLDVGVLPRWGVSALIAGNPLFGVFLLYAFYGSYIRVGIWLMAVPWVVVGIAVFRAAGRRTERPPRVR